MIQAGTISTGSATTLLGGRLVLDELHQLVAVDDLARRDGDVLAHPQTVGRRLGLHRQRAPGVVLQVGRAAHEIGADSLQRPLDDDRD